jgi:ATP-dependent protease ClpP protease subunit
MSLRNDLPKAMNFQRPKGFQCELPADGLDVWSKQVLADASSETEISIYDVIGEDWWSGDGWTGKRMQSALKRAQGRDITVKINSPGGDVFEGLAIYNELLNYSGKVTVQVMGLAASAASFIAMAADEIIMSAASMMMVHRAWGLVIGNTQDFTEAADIFAKFDNTLAEIYAARSGKTVAEVLDLLTGATKAADGTWLTGQEAVDNGFADRIDNELKAEPSASNETNREIIARRSMEAALAKAGHTRAERQRIIQDFGAPRDASANHAPRDAGIPQADLIGFLNDMKSFSNTL